jgi:hypothetical protein
MGDSLPPPAEFDLVDSFARRRGDDVEVVLADPKTELIGADHAVVLRRGQAAVEAIGQFADSGTTRRLTIRAPRSRFANGTWSLAVRRPDGREAPLAARLLVQGERPLVLLWGAKGGRSETPPAHTGARRRALSTGRRVLDRALSRLPEARAAQVRGQVRLAARRLLG